VDPATITGVLVAGNHALALLKTASEALKAAGKPEAVGSLVELQLSMMDLLQKQQALIEENRELRLKVALLEEELKTKGELEFHHNCFWRRVGEASLQGPFSPTSWELHRKLVRMRHYGRGVYEGVEKVHFCEPNSKDSAYVPSNFLKRNQVIGADQDRER